MTTTVVLPSRSRDIIRGVLAALALLVLLVGLPLLLIHTGGGLPLRTGLPDPTAIGARLSTPDDGHILLDVLLIIGWTGWLMFTVGVGAETVALRRGRLAAALPLGGVQQLAARLVTAAALLLPATHTPLLAITAAAAATPTPQPPIHQTSAAAAAKPDTTSTRRSPSSPAPRPAVRQPAEKLYTVAQPHDGQRDTLWSIAARHLGDPLRWQQIFQLNLDRPQPGGQTLTDPALIRPGWQLLMPSDAHDLPTAPVTAAPSSTRQQPTPPLPDPTSAPDATVPAPVLAPQPAPSQHDPKTPAPEKETVPSPATGHPSPETHQHDAPTVRLAAEIGGALISALLAAGFLRHLNIRRRLQRRRRTDGHTIPTPNRKLATTETTLRVAADHDLAAQLNAALRRATLARMTGSSVDPGYRVAQVTPTGLQLSARSTLCSDAGDSSLSGQEPAVLPLDSEPAPDAPALLPLLLPVGRIDEHTLLLDLERIGDLTLTGESPVVDEVLASILSETLTAPWSDTTRITVLCRNTTTAPAVLQIAAAHPDRINLLPEMTTQFLGSLDHETRALSRPRPSATTDPVLAARTSPTGEPHPAHLLVVIDLLHAREAQQLQEMQARLPRPAFTLVHANPANPAVPAASTLHVTRDAARLTPDHLDFTPYRIAAPLAQDMHDLLALTEQPANAPLPIAPHLPDDGEHDAPDGPDMPAVNRDAVQTTHDPAPVVMRDRFDPTLDDDLAAYHDTSRTDLVRISLLGPPTVTAPGPLAPNRRATSTEIVIYLATHPRGVDITDLETAIWPHGVKASTRHAALARTRAWLGSNEHGEPNLPITSGGQLRLAPTVLIDWNLFTGLVRRADHQQHDRISDLTAALNLVHGRPFENLPTGRYGWLAESLLEQHIPMAVVDVAHRLAETFLDHGDIPRAQQLAQMALSIDPYDERTWRDLMRAAAAQGNLLGVAKLRDQLVQLLEEDDEDDLAPETSDLLNELLPRKRAVND